MKVERKKSFTPVVITLETEEEFKVVRAALGHANYTAFEGSDLVNPMSVTYKIYTQLLEIKE